MYTMLIVTSWQKEPVSRLVGHLESSGEGLQNTGSDYHDEFDAYAIGVLAKKMRKPQLPLNTLNISSCSGCG